MQILMAAVLVLGTYLNPDCHSGRVLEIDGAPDRYILREVGQCRYDQVDFQAYLTPDQLRELDALFESEVGTMSACDNAVDCSQKIVDICMTRYRATATKVTFDSGSVDPCEGKCSNGKSISVHCVKKVDPKPTPIDGPNTGQQ